MAIEIDNPAEVGADRLVNAIAAYEEVGDVCVGVDFGTGINFDAVSADGAYLGGAIAPGVEISLTALTERAARISRIDLGKPKKAIGTSSREAIQIGVLYGFAGLVDGIARRINQELGGNARFIATGGYANWVVPYSEELDEIDDLLTLKGLRIIHERNPGTVAEAATNPTATQPALTDPFEIGGVRDFQPRAAGAAGQHRQLVRAPPGEALRGRPRGLRDGLQLRSPLRQREDDDRTDADPSRRASRSRSSSSARTRRRWNRAPGSPPLRAPT